MSRLTSVLIVEYGNIRLVLFEKKNASHMYFAERSLPYDGFDDRGFFNPEDVFSKVQRLFDICQEDCGALDSVSTVLLPGAFYKFGLCERDEAVPGGTVTEKDVSSLLAGCGARLPGCEATERIPLYFKSFSNPVMFRPVGEKTDRLYVTASVGYLMLSIKELFDNCAKRMGRRFICVSYCAAAAAEADRRFVKGGEKVIVVFGDGHTDVIMCKGVAPVDVRSDLWGERHVRLALADLTDTDEATGSLLLKNINLNLSFDDGDKYRLPGVSFSVKEINSRVIETLQYFAKAVAKCVNELCGEIEPAIYLTGCALCQRRGVKEIFEDEIGREVNVISSDSLNLEGCADYLVAAAMKSMDNNARQSVSEKIAARLTYRRK